MTCTARAALLQSRKLPSAASGTTARSPTFWAAANDTVAIFGALVALPVEAASVPALDPAVTLTDTTTAAASSGTVRPASIRTELCAATDFADTNRAVATGT